MIVKKNSIPGHLLLPPYRSSNLRERGRWTCLIMTLVKFLHCALSIQSWRICFYMLFCVFPVCYDVHLTHLNNDYLLTYLHVYRCNNYWLACLAWTTVTTTTTCCCGDFSTRGAASVQKVAQPARGRHSSWRARATGRWYRVIGGDGGLT